MSKGTFVLAALGEGPIELSQRERAVPYFGTGYEADNDLGNSDGRS